MKEAEGERESDRDCPSWCSLLGAGSVFGSAHCIISISPRTCLSKWRRGQPARRAALLRVSASVLDMSTVHALSHTTHTHTMKQSVPICIHKIFVSSQTHAQSLRRLLINTNSQCVSLEEMMTYAQALHLFFSPP